MYESKKHTSSISIVITKCHICKKFFKYQREKESYNCKNYFDRHRASIVKLVIGVRLSRPKAVTPCSLVYQFEVA
jgi:hypothetical protein